MNNKPIIMIGVGDFAKLIKYYLENDGNRKVAAFSVDKAYIKEDSFEGLPVVAFESLEDVYSPDQYEVIVAVGARNMNNIRKSFFHKCKEKGFSVATYIHSTCVVSKDAEIGEGNIILEKCLISPFVKIGNCNLLWDNVVIPHNTTMGSFNTMAGYSALSGFDVVGNNCYIGKCAMVFDKVKLSDYTLVGAAAYVKKDTKEYDVIVPARSVVLDGKKSTDFM